ERFAGLVELPRRCEAEDARQLPVELGQYLEILGARSRRPAHRPVGLPQPHQATKLAEGIRVVVDANVDLALPRLPFGRDDEDATRLAAAPVAAGVLGRVEGR